jgi:Derlin-2/3
MDILAEIKKIPPVTRFLCGSSLAVTGATIASIVSPYSVIFAKELVFRKFEIWRLYTSFFYGGSGIMYIFELVMLYRTVHELETVSYSRRSADFAWQLFIAAGSIVAVTLPLEAYVFARPFLVCMIYLSSNLAPPGALTSVMGLVTVPIKYFPYVLIALDFLMAGPSFAAQSVAGAVVGHLWWWSVWGSGLGSQGVWATYASAPEWVRNVFGERRSGRLAAAGGAAAGLAQGGVHVIAPRRTGGSSTRTGYAWGSGQRLGDS